ncbi:MAG TPA: OmpA family protein [Bacteroidales bacterium]|nr:OmpA family protein [Bacteroidales bacterium]
MKKTMVCLFSLLVGFALVSAQEVKVDTLVPTQRVWTSIPVNHWSFVLKGGLNNYLMAPPAPTSADRINLSFGGALEYTFNPFIGLGLEYVRSDYSRPYTYLNTTGSMEGATNDVLLFSSVNLSNVLSPYRDGFWRNLNIYGDAGAGIAMYKSALDGATLSGQNVLVGKLALNAELNVSKVLGVSLEGRYHQYDALNMAGGRSNRNVDALMLMLGLRFKLGSMLHARNISLCEYAPKTIPVVSKTTFVKGETPLTMSRIRAVELENAAINQKISKLEADARDLLAKKAAQAAAEKAALQKKLDEKDKAAMALAKKLKDLEEKARQDSILAAQEQAKRALDLKNLSAKDSVTANKLKQMEEDLKNLATQKTGTVNLSLDNVQFKSGSNVLIPSSYIMLDQVAGILKTNTQWTTLRIAGHTDNVGADANNLKLSQARAAAVKKYLVSKGVPTAKMVSIGFGETKPIATNDTPEGRQQNRRVEFEIK